MICKACGKPIDEHVAGSETDACVAEAGMGWIKKGFEGCFIKVGGKLSHVGLGYYNIEDIWMNNSLDWRPSERIADAWKVVEKFPSLGYYFDIGTDLMLWIVTLEKMTVNANRGKKIMASATEASLAICLAALRAVSE